MAFSAVAGDTNLPNGFFSPVIYSKKVLKAFRKASVVEDITNTDYAGEIENYGDTVQIILEPDITVSPYVRGQVVESTPLVDNQVTLIVDKANKFQFEVDDIEKKQSHVNWETLATGRAGYKLKDAFDTEVLAYMVAQATTASTDLGTSGSPITVDLAGTNPSPLVVMNRAQRLMDLQNIPAEERFFVADPIFWERMGDENSRLMNALYIGDRGRDMPLINGHVSDMQIRGFTCYRSNNLPVTSGKQSFLVGHMSSTCTVNQIAKIEQFRSTTSFSDVVRGLHMYGRKVLRSNALFSGFYQ